MLFSMMLSPRTTQIGSSAREIFRQAKGFGDAAFAFLIGVIDVLQPEVAAIAQQAQEIAGILAAGDQQDFLDPRVHQSLDGVIHHGLVVDRKQMLIGDAGQRIEPAAGSACKDDTFHLSLYFPGLARCGVSDAGALENGWEQVESWYWTGGYQGSAGQSESGESIFHANRGDAALFCGVNPLACNEMWNVVYIGCRARSELALQMEKLSLTMAFRFHYWGDARSGGFAAVGKSAIPAGRSEKMDVPARVTEGAPWCGRYSSRESRQPREVLRAQDNRVKTSGRWWQPESIPE